MPTDKELIKNLQDANACYELELEAVTKREEKLREALEFISKVVIWECDDKEMLEAGVSVCKKVAKKALLTEDNLDDYNK